MADVLGSALCPGSTPGAPFYVSKIRLMCYNVFTGWSPAFRSQIYLAPGLRWVLLLCDKTPELKVVKWQAMKT